MTEGRPEPDTTDRPTIRMTAITAPDDEPPTTPERSFTTLSGEPVPGVATPRDLAGFDPSTKLGSPGVYPFTRGVYPTMYRGRLWTMRQFAGFGTPAETNDRFRHLLEQGQGGLSVAFDLPTLMGLDSDDPRSEGEVGRCGVATDSLDDVVTLFDGIPLDVVTTSMTINAPATVIFAFFLVAAERQGVSWSALDGTLQTDILKEYIAQKEWVFPPRPHLRLIGDLMEFCAANVPRWHPLSVSGYHIREAGATAAQELAFTLADGFAYVELGLERGLDVNAFAPGLSFFFNAHIDVFEEVAKYRAARRIWARWLKDRYGATDPNALKLRFHTQTAGVSLTAQQPTNNVVRTAIEALAAVLGGTQSLHTNSLDEVLALPTEEAATLALRTQQVLAFETGVPDVIDPLGGSYLVESMTDAIEANAEESFDRIDRMGSGSMLEGVLAGIESGWFQKEIAESAFREQRRYESGDLVKVGVNAFVEEYETAIDTLVIGPETERAQRVSIERTRASRDPAQAEAALEALTRAATGDANLMGFLIDCARARCTEGEIVTALVEVFGDYRETPRF
jgi:methylmalonyl-CoA mutase, N-terminal domain